MNNTVLKTLLLGLLLIALFAPFSALALLMLVVFGSAVAWIFWNLVQAAIRGGDT